MQNNIYKFVILSAMKQSNLHDSNKITNQRPKIDLNKSHKT